TATDEELEIILDRVLILFRYIQGRFFFGQRRESLTSFCSLRYAPRSGPGEAAAAQQVGLVRCREVYDRTAQSRMWRGLHVEA
ncbi:MAG: hypothetical protein BJ554DRAFT_6534, partial [Olpidium bornovanus]